MRRLHYLVLVIAALVFCRFAIAAADSNSDARQRSILVEKTADGLSTEHFYLCYDSSKNQNEKIAHLLEFAYDHFRSLFESYGFEPTQPEEKLRWFVFSDNDSFNSFAKKTENQDLSWLTGYYSSRNNHVSIVVPDEMASLQVTPEEYPSHNVIACPPDAETELAKVLHEAAHQLSFNSDLQKRQVLYPLWAGEGLAMSFERSFLIRYFKSSRYTDIRAQRLAALYDQGKVIPLERFITMSRLESTENPIDVYAQAWGFFQFLCDSYPQALKNYFAAVHNQEPGFRDTSALSREFAKAFGSPDQLQQPWQQFLENLPSQ